VAHLEVDTADNQAPHLRIPGVSVVACADNLAVRMMQHRVLYASSLVLTSSRRVCPVLTSSRRLHSPVWLALLLRGCSLTARMSRRSQFRLQERVGPLNTIVENFNKYMGRAEAFAGNIWSHMKTSPSVFDAAQGRMSQGFKLVQEGGFEGLYKSTFGMAEGEQLRKTYACYLSTSTGPVMGTLYVSNLKFSFCSDRPLSYQSAPGQEAWSYYKMVVALDKVKEVIPSFNENKPQEKYIQIVTVDGHDFWFMGFVNYDKGVQNMQLALRHIGEIDPSGGLKSPWAGMSVPGMKKTAAQQPPVSPTVPGHNPTPNGPTPNYNPQAPNPYVSNNK
jgi:hypothetical protein